MRSLVLAATLLLVPVAARAVDRSLGWHTLETPHFEVHFHDGEEALAQRAGRAAEAAHALLAPRLGSQPSERTQIVLTDDTDSANGSATALLRPEIHLYADTPEDLSELNDYEDYLWNLITHEYTHVIHLGTTGGLPLLFNWLLGSLDLPNGVQPRWFIEGLAVFEESNLSQSGRIRSSLFDMYLRSHHIEGGLLPLDQVSHYPLTFPRGGVAYLYGGYFLDFLVRRHGEVALTRLSDNYGSRLVPYALNLVAREELGQSFVSLYEEWRTEMGRRFDAQLAAVRARGVTPARFLSSRGNGTGVFRLNPDGSQVYYLEESADRLPALRAVGADGRGDHPVRELVASGSFSLSRTEHKAVVSRPEIFREYSVYDDLFEIDLRSGATRRLTEGLRASEPDVSPDGQWIAFVRKLGAGATEIARLPAAGGAPQTLYHPPEGARVYTPRYSPDGTRLVFSEHRRSGRDIRLLDLTTGAISDLTADRAIDVDPSFDPSGRAVLFSSDRGGIYNVYRLDLGTGAVEQLTNVETGAFHPELSPDGKTLFFQGFRRNGFDLARAEVAPLATAPRPTAASQEPGAPLPEEEGRIRIAPEQEPRKDLRGRPAPDLSTGETYPIGPYRPLRTLWPRYWLPTLSSDGRSFSAGAMTSGVDVVGRHSYALSASYQQLGAEPGFSAAYTNQTLYPTLGFSLSRSTGALPGGAYPSYERRTEAYASASFPYSRLRQSLAATLSYRARLLEPEALPLQEPDVPKVFVPDRGLDSALGLTLAYNDARGFTYSISPEMGRSAWVSLRHAGYPLGSRFAYDTVEASVTQYFAAPWLEHHVLALRAAAGTGRGDLGGRRLFALGGMPSADPLLQLLNGAFPAPPTLRGYAPAAQVGSSYVLANAEYRFPLFHIERGLWTLPLYAEQLHAALFCDAGRADKRLAFDHLRIGVGGELRLNATLGYYLPVQLHLGYARGLAPDGVSSVLMGLGSSF